MNYRHAFHAGNFADVVKHAILTRILVHLAGKEQPFRVIDIHAGAGLYDLSSEAAERTGEWREGIGRLETAVLSAEQRGLLTPYLTAVAGRVSGGAGRWYPGSPLLALTLMRPHDRLIACELEPQAAHELAGHLRRDRRAKAIAIDGWLALNAYVPPPERRGVVVVDPPFEAGADDFTRMAGAAVAAWRKWPSGIYLLWYPIKDRRGPEALATAFRHAVIPGVLRAEVDIGTRREIGRLAATGVIVVNPPWRLADELACLLPALAEVLAGQASGIARLDWVTAEK